MSEVDKMEAFRTWYEAYTSNYAGTGLVQGERLAQQAWQAALNYGQVDQLRAENEKLRAVAGAARDIVILFHDRLVPKPSVLFYEKLDAALISLDAFEKEWSELTATPSAASPLPDPAQSGEGTPESTGVDPSRRDSGL